MLRVLLAFVLPVIVFSKDLLLVSLYPFYDVVKGIAGENFEVEVLLPPNTDYHLYELSPGDVLKISRAKVVFVSGIPAGGWEKKIEQIASHKVVKLSEGIDLLEEEGHNSPDPHVWMSPAVMKVVARNVFDSLKSLYPHRAQHLEQGYIKVLNRLNSLHTLYRQTLSHFKLKTVPISHPALSYMARDYGLNQLSLSTGGIHGGIYLKELTGLIQLMRKEGIDYFFEIYGEETKLGKLLESKYGLKVYKLNVKVIPASHYRDYFSIMRYNLSVLGKALRCR